MDKQTHWEKIYQEKAADAVSWYRAHLEKSLALIQKAAPSCSASIIDVGGGESTLVDDLLDRGYENITVLDIAQTAIVVNRKRLGKRRSAFIGLQPILRRRNCRLQLTMCGTIAPFFIFLLRHPTASPMSARGCECR